MIVILAGGVGTRLWPLGRKNNPKQFFPMVGDKPLIVETYNRFAARYKRDKIFFSVTKDLYAPLKRIFPKISSRQFIIEPSRRDTAPAMGYVAAVLSLKNPDEPMVFVPSDHFILDNKKYLDCFKVAESLVKATGKLLDIGIAATFPSTVLGYTKIGALYKKISGVSVYNFAGHTEKPNLKNATRYLKSGHYLWHGNYYTWTPKLFLQSFAKHAPRSYAVLEKITAALKNKKVNTIPALYDQLEKISFDYAITEKLKPADMLIIKGEFGWSDVGAWDTLHDRLQLNADNFGNVKKGEVIHLDTRQCLLYTHPNKILATVGLDNIVVIDTPDALLVCSKNRAQEVKNLLPEIAKRGLHKHL